MTAQERLDYLLGNVSSPTNAAITLASIKGVLPVEAYALVRLTLEGATVVPDDTPADELIQAKMIAAEMADALSALRTVGLSLSGDDRQAVVDMLAVAGSWPDAVRDAVKALGVRTQPRWQTEGYDEAPTLAVVQAEAEAEATRLATEVAMDAYRDAHSQHVVPVLDGEAPTPQKIADAFRAAADALEAI